MHDLREDLRDLAPKRSRYCGVTRQPGLGGELPAHVDVMVRQTANGPRAHFHGILRCASWSACPVCSWMLRTQRAADVVKAADWSRAGGLVVLLLTLTLAHGMGDDLRSLQRALQLCWRDLFAGQPGKRLKLALGIEHYVRGTDGTYGANGWHPHFHGLLICRRLSDAERARAIASLKARWHAVVLRRLGRHHVPSWSRGADLRSCRKKEYLAKLGLELASPQTKSARLGGRTPWDIARDAVAGDDDAAELWQTYCKAMKGARQLVWSRDLRKAAELGAEKTDQQIVDAEGNVVEEQHAASVPWRLIEDARRSSRNKRDVMYDITRGAELDGQRGVANALALHIYGLAPPEDGEPPDALQLDLFAQIAPVAEEKLRQAA